MESLEKYIDAIDTEIPTNETHNLSAKRKTADPAQTLTT